MITVSAPGKIHLLGEHAVVYGKPALLAAVDLRVYVTISTTPSSVIPTNVGIQLKEKVQGIIEPIIKKEFKIKKFPSYYLTINSELPIGAGLGFSAAISASYIAALLSFLKVNRGTIFLRKIKWDLNLINKLAYEAEKVFHGNPSGGDNSTVVYGGFIWFRKESPDLKIIQPLPFTSPPKSAKKFVFINTGKPKEITAEMVSLVKRLYHKKRGLVRKFLEEQESLVRQLFSVIREGNENEIIRIIKAGERNLESIEVVSKDAQDIIRKIEKIGGAAKISGAGGRVGPAGIVLAYHLNKSKLLKVVKSLNLPYFTAALGVEGLRKETIQQ